MKKVLIFLMAFVMLFAVSGCNVGGSSGGTNNGDNGNNLGGDVIFSENEIKITAGDAVLYATMYDNETARNFMQTLPFTLPTIERSGLAKGVHLPEYIEYESDKLTRDYTLGEIGYWPGGDIAIFYTDDLFDKTIVDVVQIGKINDGVEIFRTYDGSVTIERVKTTARYDISSGELITNIKGQSIYGVVYTPVGVKNLLPAVILSHGFGGNYNTNAEYAREFARRGYFAYTFDFRGGSPSSRSDGSTLEMSVFTEEDDLKAVVNTIRSLGYIDKERIYLFGTSQGGLVSAMIAADLQNEIRGAVLLYPAFVMADNAKAMYKTVGEIPDSTYFMWMTVGRTYFENLLDYDPYADVIRYTKDVLILHGDRDGIVPLSYSERAAKEYPSATLHVIEGAGHGFGGSDFDSAFNYSIQYIKTH